MKIARTSILALVLVFVSFHQSQAQDVFSFHPLFSESDAILLPEIEGAWEIHEFGSDTVSFQRTGDNFYTVVMKLKGSSSRYEGAFTRVGDHLLLDLLPVLADDGGDQIYKRHLLQVHSCIRVRLEKDTLHLDLLKYRWFYDNVISRNITDQYLVSDTRLILTLPTNELRAFLIEHENDAGLLEDDLAFRRVVKPQLIEKESDRSPAKAMQPTKDDTASARSQQTCIPTFPYKDGWLGGDGGLSIPISPSKTLWLFGDTYVGKKDQTSRAGSGMVTTIGISKCRPDTTVDMQYYWRNMYTDHPDHFFQSHTDRYRYWQTDGFMYRNSLYVIMSKIGPKPGASPDDIFNWSALGVTIAKVSDPDATPPDQWKIDLFPWSHVVDVNLYDGGFAEDGQYAYLFMAKEHRNNYLLRLPLDHIESPEGYLEYFSQSEMWKPGTDSADAKVLVDDQLIGRVLYHPKLKEWLMVYGPHFGGKSIYIRTAPQITGPWSDRRVLYDCPEVTEGTPQYDKDNYCYCARLLPEFFNQDADKLVVMYTCNSQRQSKLIANMRIYVPQVVVVPVPR